MSTDPFRPAVSRRRFLQGLGAGAGLVAMPAALGSVRKGGYDQRGSDLFSLGVASDDPIHDSVVLWTRLAPDPLNGGGMPSRPVAVEWELATDPDLRRVIRKGGIEPPAPAV
jgi:alkaline phosphatase D